MPKKGQARGIQIDIEGDMLSIGFPMVSNLQGDAAETLRLLLPMLHKKADTSSHGTIVRWSATSWDVAAAQAKKTATPVAPRRVAY